MPAKPIPAERDSRRFWRHPALGFLELRETRDGREVSYARHSHDSVSLGAVTGGRSLYEYQVPGERFTTRMVSRGDVVAMNPGEVHACNPCGDAPWSYVMFYLDPDWLATLQRRHVNALAGGFRPLAWHHWRDPALHAALVVLARRLFALEANPATLVGECERLFGALMARGELFRQQTPADTPALAEVAAYIRAHCSETLTLEHLAALAGVSPAHLVRRFKRSYGITPHAYLTDCRVRQGQIALKRGEPIAEVALACRFADQAHFQRAFKRLTAITPHRYRAVTSLPASAHSPVVPVPYRD
ncbi:AraC family transcriptional regulator [Salinicola sp. JS01]|uniref:AraC family transcriptional regulator n=1 Tax=Salinicola sp. JS01 TaxID=3050071 RepID=UPI00255BC9C8|nr:AraC family transcriptional regulator [Salinicola sp. JS01]WIX33636.1 AraC family transcriptional regulator [Salinicola sp. JS01]